ncbi:TlpA family protein disulfide reductase [Formosa sp. S-31]|uniref:TlpA family protein disulfide reductase n=1 Tax=Formosa sp. S-31 TaxID=2790949 RepID=UPI003EB97E30
MKFIKPFVSLFLITLFTLSCSNKPSSPVNTNVFNISGTIKGMGNDLLFTRILDSTSKTGYRIDTLKIVNDSFSYTGFASSVEKREYYSKKEALIKKVDRGWIPAKSNYLTLYVFPGAQVEVTGEVTNYMNAFPSGDITNTKLTELNKLIYPLINTIADKNVAAFYEKDTIVKNQHYKVANTLALQVQDLKIDFITKNLNSVVSVETMLDMVGRKQLEGEAAIALFENLNPQLSNTSYYKELKKRINGIKNTRIGQTVTNIKTTSTLYGDLFDLSTYKGQFVILDFWGTWCGPCVSEMPELSTYYHENKQHLKIVAINSGDIKQRISDFLEKHPEYDWIQLLSEKGDTESNFVNQFNVTNFPTKIILNPQGKILKKYVGYDKDMYSFIDNQIQTYYFN